MRLLVVDDDASLLRAVRRSLRSVRDEIELTLLDSGIDALVQVGAERPDLIVMDVFMPGLNGVEACRSLKANPATADIRVILVSAAVTAELEASAREAGADAVLDKPVDLTAILAGLGVRAPRPAARGTEAPPLAEASARRGADVLVDMLAAAGVEQIFGLPGGAISPVHDALLDSSIRVITTRHESGAMFAAAGYARATGKLGVAVVTSGPGALNAMTGLASAWCDGLPVLLLIGEVPRPTQGKGVLQDGSAHGLRIIEMMRPVAKLAVEVPEARQLPHLVRRAMATALSGRRGPVALSLPMDVTTGKLTPPVIAGTMRLDSVLPLETLDEVVDLLDGASRPLLLVGSGATTGAAPALLAELVARTGVPVATTPKAKGVLPESSPYALGVLGLGGHPSAKEYLQGGVDVLVALGTSLGDLATDGFSPLIGAGRALVHVDIDARQIGKSYSPTLAVVASAEGFLAGLLTQLPDDVPPRPPVGGVRRHPLPSSATAVAPQDILAEIQAILPGDTLYTADSGDHFIFATHYLRLEHPDAYLVMTGLGSMGQSIGAAIGAQLAHPGRCIAAIVGDGCFAMNAFEVATAVAEKLPLRVFVFNDGALGMVENGHETVYGRRPNYSTGPLDVVGIAAGLGAATVRVQRAGQLAAHADLLRHHPGPVVVDVRIDGTIKLPKKDRMGAFAPKPQVTAQSAKSFN
ncbi:MAG: thiamine pyrophosphate-binding protein [Kofleriaceae bacterium]